MRKAEIGIQTIFYILMIVFMVGIVMFGYSKLTEVETILSAQERSELIKDLEQALFYCEDPLNRGNVQQFRIESQKFDSVCLLDNDVASHSAGTIEGVVEIYNAGENVVLLDSTIVNGASLVGGNVIDSFKLSVELDEGETFCWYDTDADHVIEFEIEC